MAYHSPVYPSVSVSAAILLPSEKVPNPLTCLAPLLKLHGLSSQDDTNLVTQALGATFDPLRGQLLLASGCRIFDMGSGLRARRPTNQSCLYNDSDPKLRM